LSSVVPATRRRGVLLPVLITLAALGVLLALGSWQLERKAWKDALVASLRERLGAPVAALPAREVWPRLEQRKDEFRRVSFPAEFLHAQEALVYSAGSALRTDVSGPGYWVFTPARLTGGSLVMINRGFVPEANRDPATRSQGQQPGSVEITGYLRWPEQRGLFSPTDDPEHNLWYLRDHAAIAAAKGVEVAAPFYIDQEAPQAPGGVPKAGPLSVSLPNNHLQYALTWFGLALCLVGVFVAWLVSRARNAAA
jgi:surfeit locus 1 family protein